MCFFDGENNALNNISNMFLEYASQVWHLGLTLNLVHDLERRQIKAMFIIHLHLSYWEALDTFGLTNLVE